MRGVLVLVLALGLALLTIRTAIKHGNYVENPSMRMQNVLASTLGLLGELLGYRAVNPKYVDE